MLASSLAALLALPGLAKVQGTRTGMVQGDAFVFSTAISSLPAGYCIQFGVNLENLGKKAPLHYIVEFFDGGQWVSDPAFVYEDGLSEYSFRTVSSAVKHPSTFMAVYRLQSGVKDSLRVRCRVCSPFAADGSLLSADEPENKVALKKKNYVAWKLQPLGPGEGFPAKHILLIGNSFTYFFGEPFMLQEIAFSQGMILQVNASLKGGQTYRQHCGLEMTQAQCELPRNYDFAIIQGQSQEPAKFAAAPDSLKDVSRAFCELCARIRANHPDCRIFAERTWAYPALENGGFASLEEFDSLLDMGSKMLADAAGVERTLVGNAFTKARAEAPEILLLDYDDKHQSRYGSYLKACVTWLTISRRNCFEGRVPSCGLPEKDTAALRKVAEEVAAE